MTYTPLKVLLVDDEPNTRNLLRLCIDWEALGMEIIADATSGTEALNIIEEFKPDIVLTDIEMPYMDGITLSKHIMGQHIDIYIVIITAHEQFTYAQQAVSIGVSDFILKPIDADLITATLKKLAEKIIAQRQKLSRLEMSYQYIKDNALELRNKFLNKVIYGSFSIRGLMDPLDIIKNLSDQTSYPLHLAAIKILFETDKYTSAQRHIILINCTQYIEETFSSVPNFYAFIDADEHIILLCSEKNSYLPELGERITNYLKTNLDATVYCGIGPPAPYLEKVASSYQYARNVLKLCYILDEQIIYHHNPEDLNIIYKSASPNLLEHLIILVKSGLDQQATKTACELLQQTLSEGITNLNLVKYEVICLLTQLKDALVQTGISATSLGFNETSYSHLIHLKLYGDVEKYVIDRVSEFCHIMNNENGSRVNDTISQIIQYLEDHYADENLSLTHLAKVFYLNPSYLSRIFKKATHKSFTEYLVGLRVQKAVDMLHLSNYKAYQLAQMVGIPDPNYFIKCFRKVTGVSLQEFKALLT